jgi:hypothetical protein
MGDRCSGAAQAERGERPSLLPGPLCTSIRLTQTIYIRERHATCGGGLEVEYCCLPFIVCGWCVTVCTYSSLHVVASSVSASTRSCIDHRERERGLDSRSRQGRDLITSNDIRANRLSKLLLLSLTNNVICHSLLVLLVIIPTRELFMHHMTPTNVKLHTYPPTSPAACQWSRFSGSWLLYKTDNTGQTAQYPSI